MRLFGGTTRQNVTGGENITDGPYAHIVPPPRKGSGRGNAARWAYGGCGVLLVIRREHRDLVVVLREEEEDERRPEQHGDDTREVRPLVALQEGPAGRLGDLGRVLTELWFVRD